jgi:hypothetical protein
MQARRVAQRFEAGGCVVDFHAASLSYRLAFVNRISRMIEI